MEKSNPRSSKACDRCRLKKVKCDGLYPCARCTKDDNACVFGSRGKGREATVSANHVEQLQAQTEILKLALKTTWAKYVKPTMSVGTEEPSIHEMCRQVGVLDNPDLRQIHRSPDDLFPHHSSDSSPMEDQPGELSEEEDLPDVPPLIFENSNDASGSNDTSGSGVEFPHWGYDPALHTAGPPNIDMMYIPTFERDAHNPFSASKSTGGPYLHGPTLLSQREPLSLNAYGHHQQRSLVNHDQKHYYGHGADFDNTR